MVTRTRLINLFVLTSVLLANLLFVRNESFAYTLGLTALALGFGIQLVFAGQKFARVPLLAPLFLFLLSAGIGVWASYDSAVSWNKFFLIVGGVALYLALATLESRLVIGAAVWGFSILGAALALYFATQHNFTQEPAKLGIITQIGLQLNRVVPQLSFHQPHPNVAAGTLEVALPITLGLLLEQYRKHAWLKLLAALALSTLIAFGLIMTSSRGALLALAVVGILGVSIYALDNLLIHRRISRRIWIPLGLNALLIAILLLLRFGGSVLATLAGPVSATQGVVSRVELYSQVQQLVGDYVFTGGGLGVFPMIFSTYALLISNFFLPHSHNLFLQIWMEQGLLGFVAWLWLALGFYAWVWGSRAQWNWIALGGVAATSVMLLHGVLDVVIYSTRVLPVLFVPLGITVGAISTARAREVQDAETRAAPALGLQVALGLGVALLVGLLVIFVVRSNQFVATWHANLGSVEETRLELSQYNYPVRLVDRIRRETDLSTAESLFEQALTDDPNNALAHRRLGLIELDRRRFEVAITHLETAWRVEPDNRAIRKALGYAYTWVGRFNDAEPLLRAIPEAPREMDQSVFAWEKQGRADLARRARAMAQRLSASAAR